MVDADLSNLPDDELEMHAEIPDSLGGSVKLRASARAELKKREREAAQKLADRQLEIATKQAISAGRAVLAAWGGVAVTFLGAAVTFLSYLASLHSTK